MFSLCFFFEYPMGTTSRMHSIDFWPDLPVWCTVEHHFLLSAEVFGSLGLFAWRGIRTYKFYSQLKIRSAMLIESSAKSVLVSFELYLCRNAVKFVCLQIISHKCVAHFAKIMCYSLQLLLLLRAYQFYINSKQCSAHDKIIEFMHLNPFAGEFGKCSKYSFRWVVRLGFAGLLIALCCIELRFVENSTAKNHLSNNKLLQFPANENGKLIDSYLKLYERVRIVHPHTINAMENTFSHLFSRLSSSFLFWEWLLFQFYSYLIVSLSHFRPLCVPVRVNERWQSH